MITIRRAQLQVLGDAAMRNFEARAMAHLKKFFPEQTEALGEEALLKAVRFGIERAETYQLETERDILRYLTLMFTFGKNFDQDPKLPWAKALLTSNRSAESKTNDLQEKARNNRSLGRGFQTIPHPAGTEERN